MSARDAGVGRRPAAGPPGRRRAAALVCFLAWSVALFVTAFPDPQGTDAFPAGFCSAAVWRGEDPYDPGVAARLSREWDVSASGRRVAAVCAYPLPFYLLVGPLAALPYEWSGVVWAAAGPAAALAFRTGKADPLWLLVPLSFYPLFHAAVLKTPAAAWLFLTIVGVGAARRGGVPAGITGPILALKPQVGLFFSCLPLMPAGPPAARGDPCPRTRLVRARTAWACALLFLVAVSEVVLPGWVWGWEATVRIYARDAVVTWALPFWAGVAVCVVAGFLWSRGGGDYLIPCAGLAQVLTFPANDLYSALPLLFVWRRATLPRALVGSGVSWAAPLCLDDPNDLRALSLLVVCPALLVGVPPWERLLRRA